MKTVIGPPEAGKSRGAPRVSRPGNEQEGAQTTMTKAFFAWSGVAVLAALMAAPALADWNPGDEHKMHYPQLPMVDGGYDVKASYYLFLADDWMCSETGLVDDIHLWVSYQGDKYFEPSQIHTAIYANVPADPNSAGFSKPGELIRHWDWLPGAWTMREYASGPQGWLDPRDPAARIQPIVPDHRQVWQINIEDITQKIAEELWFTQEVGTIYWLEVSFQPNESLIGWKESADHFEDDAVWRTNESLWAELINPDTGLSMDLAFVITPEPAAVVLLAVGSLLLRRRRA